MNELATREFHEGLRAVFGEVNGAEVVRHHGDWRTEHRALTESAGVLDLGFRGRLCVLGEDRQTYLHGQVTNDINRLKPGQGCYAALVTNKGKLISDLNVYALAGELLLDCEPGMAETVAGRLRQFIVADDVEICDVSPHFGLLSVQGPRAADVIRQLGWENIPSGALDLVTMEDATLGPLYLARHARCGSDGFDLFAPVAAVPAVADKLIAAAASLGGGACGWEALEAARIEAGIPRFGQDMDETNLAPEAGIEARAISYRKGCYIGQEVLNRVHTMGQVSRALCRLEFAHTAELPGEGTKLFKEGREAGHVTSAIESPRSGKRIGLGYVRKECNAAGIELALAGDGSPMVRVLGRVE